MLIQSSLESQKTAQLAKQTVILQRVINNWVAIANNEGDAPNNNQLNCACWSRRDHHLTPINCATVNAVTPVGHKQDSMGLPLSLPRAWSLAMKNLQIPWCRLSRSAATTTVTMCSAMCKIAATTVCSSQECGWTDAKCPHALNRPRSRVAPKQSARKRVYEI